MTITFEHEDLQIAYETLKNPDTRKIYDVNLENERENNMNFDSSDYCNDTDLLNDRFYHFLLKIVNQLTP